MFVLLGRDASAPAAIRAWATARVIAGKNRDNDAEIIEARNAAAEMEIYRATLRPRAAA